jgi:feruloyl esterase
VSDAIFSVDDTKAWYTGLAAANGGNASDFARFYRVPGMNHCAGGPSTDQFDMLTALENWVEKKQAPANIPASRVANGQTVRTRPLCPYPQTATYRGSGSTDDASSFVCK